ncbi:MAG: patatin-like phospholipase family protein [Burkholderiaceae bacterium]|nr:patatin-like phospholipase family protein [Burkholderiaceae bacterium]
MSNARRTPRHRKKIDLALQGGGAHGAFTWGVLDRLLEDDRLEISAVSGSSAGAMNAVVMAAGLMAGGRRQAREALRAFWASVGASAQLNPLNGGLFGTLFASAARWSPVGQYLDLATRVFSPYQLNPLNLNPLRQVIADAVDFDAVRRCDRIELFVGATHVRSGRLRVFRNPELSVDVVLASACLPMLFQAVEVDGEAYWDGGYMGNPTLLPLVDEATAADVLLVQVNPIERAEVPTRAPDILARIDEITFNGSLIKEMRSIALLKRLLRDEGRPIERYREPLFQRVHDLRLHRLDGGAELARLGDSSRMAADPATLARLHRLGASAAHAWLAHNFAHIGRRSTLDLVREFSSEPLFGADPR